MITETVTKKGKRWAVLERTEIPTPEELSFAAGFMEGDGYFGKNPSSVAAEFCQKDDWIILWFQRKFGGAVGQIHKQGLSKGSYWRWRISGDRARQFMRETYVFYSPRRKAQIDGCLAFVYRGKNHVYQE